MTMTRAMAAALLAAILGPASVAAQTTADAQQASPTTSASQLSATSTERLRPDYVLGPGDQIVIRAFELPDISDRPFRIDGVGDLNLPHVGVIQAGGRTVAELEALLTERLKVYVRNPQVSVTVSQFRSEPVFFVGAFQKPGIYPLQGKRSLMEMISAIGGLQPNASRRIKITRRKEIGEIPLPHAVESPDGEVSSVEISLASLRENVDPAEDITLMPFDVVSVDRAEMVYVNGEVSRVGAFEMEERESMALTQVLTMAGGLSRDAAPKKARILRRVQGTSRRAEIPVDISRVLEGRDRDFPLLADDLLYVPRKSGFARTLGGTLRWVLPVGVSVTSLAVALTR